MGTNKAFLEAGGQTLLARALGTLRLVCDRVAIVGDAETYSRFGPCVADIFSGCGPLGGIHSALVSSSDTLNIVLAVDMPFVSADLLRFVLDIAGSSAAMVTVPRAGKRLQPLCAVYRREFAAVAEQALGAGNYKVDGPFASVRVRVIEAPELLTAGFSEKNFLNVNTPEELRAAEGQ